MKKRRIGVGLLLGVALSGCLSVSHKLTLHPDGSGSLEFQYRAPIEAIQEWEAMLKEAHLYGEVPGHSALAFDEAALRDAFKDFDPDELSLVDAHVVERHGMLDVRMLVQFRSLEALASANLIDPRSVSLQFTDEQPVTLFIRVGDPRALPPAHAEEGADIDLALELELPSDIVETNGQQIGPRTVRWQAQGLAGPQGLLAMSRQGPRVVFENQGLQIAPFGQQHIRLPVVAPNAEIP